MENAIVSLFCIALLLVGTLTMGMTSLSLVDKVSASLRQTDAQRYEIRQTEIATVNATIPAAYSGARVEIAIRNDGAVPLADFDRWDVIIRYEDGTVRWLPYDAATPGWTVGEMSFGDSPEVFEPNILNTGEEMQLILSLDQPVSANSTSEVTVSTPKGIIARTMFKREVS